MSNIKYTKELLQEAVDNSLSFAGVLRHLQLRQAGGTQSWITSKIKRYNIDTSHFTGARWNKGRTNLPKKSKEDILIILGKDDNRIRHNQLKRAMIESGVKYLCAICECNGPWRGKPLTLDVDHIDGDWRNNLLENLRFLCPNCHAQQPTNKPHKYAGVVER